MSEKQLLIESCEFGLVCNLSNDKKTKLKEALEVSKKSNDCLIVKGVAATRLDKINQNGRIYPTSIMQQAIEEAKPKMKAKMLVCSGSEHPEQSWPKPEYVSHYVTDAYIKNVLIEDNGRKERQNVLFCDICVLPTVPHGVNMQKFIAEGVGIGLSIRGLGECDATGKVTSYDFLGLDLVGLPSSSVYLSTVVNESVEVSAAPLTETFVVSTSATNVVRDLQSAQELVNRLDDIKYGTINKTSTKVDSEIDPKTGAETTLVTLETDTEDEVTDIDQALMLAKKAITNGQADIDSVTIENVKEEQPKESVENSDVPLNEENHDDDEERYGTCAWCGEELPLSDLKKEKDLGYICNHCARGLESREGPLDFEEGINERITPITNYILMNYPKDSEGYKVALRIQNDLITGRLEDRQSALNELKKYINVEYVPESVITEDEDENPYVLLGKICKNTAEDSWIQKKARQMANSFEHGKIDQATFASRLKDMLLINNFELPESVEMTEGVDKVRDAIIALMWNEGLTVEEACRAYSEMHDNVIPYEYLLTYMKPAGSINNILKTKNESVIIEAKKEEDPKAGRKFVLKCPAGFVAMDGNALVFKDNPKEALHFIVGKEESGLVHLSGVEKILDTMGVYDVEKYYRKDTTDISAPDGIANNETPAENTDVSKEEQKEGLITGDGNAVSTPNHSGQAILEDNGSNTRFEAQVEIQGQNGSSSETIPVSAVEMEGITNEVGNLYNMKVQKADGPITIKVRDTSTNETFIYNPESKQVEPLQTQTEPQSVEQPVENNIPQEESAGDLELKGNKLSMEVDDNNKVEKEFKTPEQAAIAKAGIEAGKLGGDVLMSEDNEKTPQYQDAPDYALENIKPGYYTLVKGVGVVGPYESEEALRLDLKDILGDDLDIGFVNQEDIDNYKADQIAAESTNMSEVIYKNPGEASDPYVEKPLEDSVSNEDFIVDVSSIDWDNKDFINKFMSNMEPTDVVNTADMISKIKDLPDSINLKMNVADLPDGEISYDAVKKAVCDKLGKMYVMKVNDVDIRGLHSIQ